VVAARFQPNQRHSDRPPLEHGDVNKGNHHADARCIGVVARTGQHTEIGRISGMLSEVESLTTPLMRRLDAFTRTLSIAIVALAMITFAIGTLLWGRDWSEIFFAAVSIAVAAIPEGLPVVMTVTLAIGVARMARRNAIIRKLPAVDTLGAVTTICADKPGTLTRNEMTAKSVVTATTEVRVEGVGYEPEGGFTIEGEATDLEQRGDDDWMLCIAVGLVVFVVVEAEKMLQRKGLYGLGTQQQTRSARYWNGDGSATGR
jgi:magnesium-transporting ATPase (P-type)